VTGTDVARVPLEAPWRLVAGDVERAIQAEPDVVFVCSPNNPTGNTQPRAAVEALTTQAEALVVVDEAYVEFGARSVADMIRRSANLVVVRTFSKAFALAGAASATVSPIRPSSRTCGASGFRITSAPSRRRPDS
jgi:histidinol-phosphate aminotransferase